MGKTFKRNSKERFKKNYRDREFDPFKKSKKGSKFKPTFEPTENVVEEPNADDYLE